MELSDVIITLEDIREQIYKRVMFNKYVTIVSKLDDVIAELKEVDYEHLNNIVTLHLQENKRRIEDLEKENKRLKEEIQKSNNDWCSFVAALFICVMNRGDENEPLT